MALSIREKIIEYLATNHFSTAAQLSNHLRVTLPDIRYHLKELLDEKQIEEVTRESNQKLRKPRGRPVIIYRLKAEVKPDNLNNLSMYLLSLIFNKTTSSTEKEYYLDQLAEKIAGHKPTYSSLPIRLNHTINRLNENSYQARWEAHAQGAQIRFHNCPYRKIIKDHPELCTMDLKVLRHLTGQDVTTISLLDIDTEQPPFCTFLVK